MFLRFIQVKTSNFFFQMNHFMHSTSFFGENWHCCEFLKKEYYVTNFFILKKSKKRL
jgi:hypothetical protein